MGGGVGGINYAEYSDGSDFNYKFYNLRGDVIMTLNPNNTVKSASRYYAFGTHDELVGSITTDKHRANTKVEDSDGLLNEGHRFRSLEHGVFLTPDPLEYVDGPNMYIYVGQNPWGRFDPLGLAFLGWNTWDEYCTDFKNGPRATAQLASNIASEYPKVMGGIQMIGGGFEAAAGFSFAVGTAETGVGVTLGVAVGLHGVDNARAGYQKMMTGQNVDTSTSLAIQAVGLNRDDANIADALIGITGSLGTGVLGGASKVAAIAATDEAAGMSVGQILARTEKGAKALSNEKYEILGGASTSALKKADLIDQGLISGASFIDHVKNFAKSLQLAPTGLTPLADITSGTIGATAQAGTQIMRSNEVKPEPSDETK